MPARLHASAKPMVWEKGKTEGGGLGNDGRRKTLLLCERKKKWCIQLACRFGPQMVMGCLSEGSISLRSMRLPMGDFWVFKDGF